MTDSSSDLPTRPSLLLRLRDPQDAAAWQTCVDVYGPLVYHHCRRRGLRHEDAEDVTQRVFARLAGAIARFEYRPESGRFRDWLGTLVRNEVNRFWKQDQRAVHGRGDAPEGSALDDVADRGEDTAWAAEFQAHVLRLALDRSRPHFREDTWRAFELVWLENRPAAQVAVELGQPIDWVYVAKSRVLKQLWQEVRELADDSALPG
jgi:RNA polymerase sigma-70 factor (ECF subfamily)